MLENKHISFNFIMKDNKLRITEHVALYEFTNFVADFGGYLGLFLGASLFSMFDGFVKIVHDKFYPSE